MFGPPSFFKAFLAFLTILSGCESLTTTILKPIRSTGNEVGLIFIPGTNMKSDQYNETARVIQESTELRVWVALTGDYQNDKVYTTEISSAIEDAISELKKAGMTSELYAGVGHGWGGYYLQEYAQSSNKKLKALVLMGSATSRTTSLRDFPIPVLTLAAELDGVTRITRIAVEYEKLTHNMTSFFKGLYRTPVIYIEGANHAQFASGGLNSHIKLFDLKANVTEEDAHREIGKYFNAFLTVTFSSDDSKIDEALNQLSDAFLQTVKKFQPFLDVRNLDTDGEESMWTILAQEYFADEYGDRVAVSNEILESPWFFAKEPIISFNDDDMIIRTIALIHAEEESYDPHWAMDMESPLEINMKLVSKDAIWKALGKQRDRILRSEPNTCRSLNQLAVILALSASTEKARERYLSQGRPIILESDTNGIFFMWGPSPLEMWENESGLHVSAISLISDQYHYCKVMSPYRAMEWINVDSLRDYQFSG
ncbi:hypothetical protein RRG08_061820 [Elysia crispata]|uniref:Alpha/beta hydrolase fold-5 domain-containing protein n=1 Tax=Elysia crispata TaxID=231223 RepID=A0AAE1A331_9GAST|nr:hypothetical protein RRG08_061820 [Elysia crispata]